MTHPLINSKPRQDRSVVVKQPMSFGPALELLKLGARICRWEWRHYDNYLVKFMLNIPDELIAPLIIEGRGQLQPQNEWQPTTRDLFAEDWYLYPIREPK